MKNLFLVFFAGLFAASAGASAITTTAAYHCKSTSAPATTIEILENNSAGTAVVNISNGAGPIIEQEVQFATEYQSVPGQPYKVIKTWRSADLQVAGTFYPEMPSRNFSATAIWRGQSKKVSYACTY